MTKMTQKQLLVKQKNRKKHKLTLKIEKTQK